MVIISRFSPNSFSLLFIILFCMHFVWPSSAQKRPLEVFVVGRRSASVTMPTPEEDHLSNIIFSGRISGEEGEEKAAVNDVRKDHLVLDEEEGQTAQEMDGRPAIFVVTDDIKQKPAKPTRKRYLVSRSALRQKLINGRRRAKDEQEDPLLLVEEAVSSPFDSRPSLNSLAATNKAVAEATEALLSHYHASAKNSALRLCGERLVTRTREICQHCQPAHLRPVLLVEKKRGATSSTAIESKNVEKLTDMCCVRRCTDETIRRLCCSDES